MSSPTLQFLSITSNPSLTDRWRTAIAPLGGTHTACDGLVTALRRIPERPLDAILLDSAQVELTLDRTLRKIRHRAPEADLLVVTDETTDATPGMLERWSASVVGASVSAEDLTARLERILLDRNRVKRCGWVGLSPSLRSASELVLSAAPSDATVLIEGESGTGKELAARAIHENSQRSGKPFLAVNCSAFAESILESELFGHEKGAFTDAFGRKKGVFEAADGGTIFLDEIGETSPGVQSRLLRVLEEHKVRRVGSTESIPVDFRIVAATNRDLAAGSAAGHFRRDLYFRLAVVQLTLPPLRERRGDIPVLLMHHLRNAPSEGPSLKDRVTEDGLTRLIDYDWPGNIRELRNFVERATVRFPDAKLDHDAVGELLTSVRPVSDLPVVSGRRSDSVEREMIFAALTELKRDLDYLKRTASRLAERQPPMSAGTGDGSFPSMRELERQRILDALRQAQGNRAKAARLLGIGERTLYRKIREWGL
ncbi:MAG: sigma-54 dependent transcriptional regulator [Candidatus Zixiibacteriota bacterium]